MPSISLEIMPAIGNLVNCLRKFFKYWRILSIKMHLKTLFNLASRFLSDDLIFKVLWKEVMFCLLQCLCLFQIMISPLISIIYRYPGGVTVIASEIMCPCYCRTCFWKSAVRFQTPPFPQFVLLASITVIFFLYWRIAWRSIERTGGGVAIFTN